MSATVLLRADAGAGTGTGHVMRCVALAEAWTRRGGRAVLAAPALPPSLHDRVVAAGATPVTFDAAPGTQTDADATATLAARHGAAVVFADGYAFGAAWQRELRRAGLAVASADDDGQLDGHEADLVLDQNLGADAATYGRRAAHTRLLLGTTYVLLRREFIGPPPRPAAETAERASRVLLTFGGSDPHDLTTAALAALGQVDGEALSVRVLVGAANPRADALRARARNVRPHAVRVVADAADVPAHMRWADVAVTAAGSTCWELAYLGVPAVAVVAAENQQRIAEQLDAAGAAVNAGWHAGLTPDVLASALRRLLGAPDARRAMRRRGMSLVDGRGAARVADALQALAA